MDNKGAKQTKKKRKMSALKKFLIVVASFFGLILLGYVVYFMSYLPAYIEVGEMAKDPMASKNLLGMKLRSSREQYAIPASRGFLGKPTSAGVYRYFEFPAGETQAGLLKKLRETAEKNGWRMDYESDNFVTAKKEPDLTISILVKPDSDHSPVSITISKP